MKNLLLLCFGLLFSFASYSQNCKFSQNEVDEFTGQSVTVLDIENIGKGKGLFAFASKIEGNFYLYLSPLAEIGCVTGESYVIMKLSDGSTIEYKHAGEISCSNPILTAPIDNELEALKSNNIDKIRIVFDRSYVDIEIKKKDFLVRGLKCLS